MNYQISILQIEDTIAFQDLPRTAVSLTDKASTMNDDESSIERRGRGNL